MKLYHGSNQVIKTPDLSKGRKFLDFGNGFYLSASHKQAENRARSAIFTYIKISLANMVVRLIVEKNNIGEQDAIFAFYNSKIADKLADINSGLYLFSPYIIYELWNTEYQTGDFKQSPYFWSML